MSHLIANLPSLMNEYASAVYKKEVRTPLFMKKQMLGLFNPIAADTYVAPTGTITDLFQGCQCPPVEKGNTSFSAEELTTECGEIFFQINECDLELHWKKWMYQFNESGKKPETWQFAQYVYDNLLIPKRDDEEDHIAWAGVKVAPTTGTAGATLATFTGLKERLTVGRASGTKPITQSAIGTLAVDGSDRYDKMTTFLEGFSTTFQSLPGTIYMSAQEARLYRRAKRAEFPYEQILGTEMEIVVDDFPGKRIVGIDRMNGSKMWFFVPDIYKTNLVMLHGLGQPINPQGYWSVTDDFKLRFRAKYYRAYGYEYAAGLVVNDQV